MLFCLSSHNNLILSFSLSPFMAVPSLFSPSFLLGFSLQHLHILTSVPHKPNSTFIIPTHSLLIPSDVFTLLNITNTTQRWRPWAQWRLCSAAVSHDHRAALHPDEGRGCGSDPYFTWRDDAADASRQNNGKLMEICNYMWKYNLIYWMVTRFNHTCGSLSCQSFNNCMLRE